MIDNRLDLDTFNHLTSQMHQSGIDKFGKAYKQHSHQVLVSTFFQIIDQLPVDCALEIGAFSAEFSQRFVSAAETHKAIAVEANPYNFDKFKHSVTANGVLYHHAAVLDREGPCELQLQMTDVDIATGYIRGNNSILVSDARPHTRAVTVPGTTLDALVASYVTSQLFPAPSVSRPVLWIDVEGALNLVIRGGQRTIADSLLIFAEVEAIQLWNAQATFADIVAQLDELGFSPWLRDCEYEPDQFNVLFFNRKHINIEQLKDIETQYYRQLENFTP